MLLGGIKGIPEEGRNTRKGMGSTGLARCAHSLKHHFILFIMELYQANLSARKRKRYAARSNTIGWTVFRGATIYLPCKKCHQRISSNEQPRGHRQPVDIPPIFTCSVASHRLSLSMSSPSHLSFEPYTFLARYQIHCKNTSLRIFKYIILFTGKSFARYCKAL